MYETADIVYKILELVPKLKLFVLVFKCTPFQFYETFPNQNTKKIQFIDFIEMTEK